jgi:AraC-like DNA-binding protein
VTGSIELEAGEQLAPGGPVRLRQPRPGLAPAVSVLWLTEVAAGGLTRVLPDAAVDLVLSGGGLVVAGPDTRPVREQLVEGPVLGVQVRPGAVPAVLGVPAQALLNGRVELGELWGVAGRVLAERLAAALAAGDLAGAATALEDAVLARLHDAETTGPPLDRLPTRVRAALAAGQPDIRVLAADVGLGERQLRRRSVAAFGYGPRTLARILRFQRVLDALRSPTAPPLAQLAAREGYTDQAHLTREVTAFAGLTPTTLRTTLTAVTSPR